MNLMIARYELGTQEGTQADAVDSSTKRIGVRITEIANPMRTIGARNQMRTVEMTNPTRTMTSQMRTTEMTNPMVTR